MIPFFSWTVIELGPITLQVWGICVALGALIALFFCLREVKKSSTRVVKSSCHSERSEESLKVSDKGSFTSLRSVQDDTEATPQKTILSEDVMWNVFFWLVFSGFIGARIFHIIFYEPAFYLGNPGEILKIWHGGASSLGGFLGALAGLLIFLKTKKLRFADFKPYAEIIGIYFWLGWAIGRAGCFLIHDHIGRLSDCFLAVNFPYGARYDLGLFDSLLALIIFFILFFTRRIRAIKKAGSLVLGFSLYAVGRFFLDFLRADDILGADARYFHLTPAQWGIIVFFAGLTFWRIRAKIKQQK